MSPLEVISPTNLWESSDESPNNVEPLAKIIDALVIYVWYSAAVNLPSICKLTLALMSPFKCKAVSGCC